MPKDIEDTSAQMRTFFERYILDTKRDIRHIKKIRKPAQRRDEFQKIRAELKEHHGGKKPQVADVERALNGAIPGALLGLAGGVILFSGFGVTLAAAALIAATMLSTSLVGAGVATLVQDRSKRKDLRDNFGSIKTAKRLWKVSEKVRKEAGKTRSLKSAKRPRKQFAHASTPKTPAAPKGGRRFAPIATHHSETGPRTR